MHRFSHNLVEVGSFRIEGSLPQQAAHSPDDLAGAPIIMQNIAHDVPEFPDVRGWRFQYRIRGFGVGQDGAERLVYLMSNRGGQLASQGKAVDMGKFFRALRRLYFGLTTPTMRVQQGRD